MRDLTPLCLMAKKHGTDKGGRHLSYYGRSSHMTHEYTPIYWDMLCERSFSVRHVLELGVHFGASLRMWREFFPNAMIFGLDSNAAALIEEDRIHCMACDCGDIADTQRVQGILRPLKFDLIIDDASHDPGHQKLTVMMWSQFLKDDGILVVEDIGHDAERVRALSAAVPVGFTSWDVVTDPVHGGDGRPENLFFVERE